MKLIIDLDNTLANSSLAILKTYQYITNDYSSSIDDLKGYNLLEICKQWNKKDLMDAFDSEVFFNYLLPYKNSIEVLKKLQDNGHEIVFVTIHLYSGVHNKALWIKKYYPFIKKVVYYDSSETEKIMFMGDCIIDDNILCLITSPCLNKICYGNYPYNTEWQGNRATDWNKAYKIIQDLYNGAI